jgi:hypothetical protein
MAFVIQSETLDPNTGEIRPTYAKTVGKTNVKWTPDRDEARRYRHYDTAAKAVARIAEADRRGAAGRAVVAPDNAGG